MDVLRHQSILTWRPVHREARETLQGHLFPTRGDNTRFDNSTVLPALERCAADESRAIFNATEQARRLAFGRESIGAFRGGIKGMTCDARVRQRPIAVHLTIHANLDVSGNHSWWNATTDLLALLQTAERLRFQTLNRLNALIFC